MKRAILLFVLCEATSAIAQITFLDSNGLHNFTEAQARQYRDQQIKSQEMEQRVRQLEAVLPPIQSSRRPRRDEDAAPLAYAPYDSFPQRALVPSPVVPAQPLLREPTRQTTKPLPVVSAEKFVELEAASLARMFARYPSLKDRENPWRKKLDAYVGQQRADPKRTEFFNTSNWPERIVLEFGVVHGIADANGNAIQR